MVQTRKTMQDGDECHFEKLINCHILAMV